MNKPKFILMLLLASTLLSSCGADSTKVKQTVQTALTMQTQIKNDVFSGSVDLDLGNLIPQPAGGNAITNSLIGLLQNSKISWQGVENLDPMQLEVDLKATPAGQGTAFDMPVLLKDNKLYLNIPLLSKPNEYFSVDLATDGMADGQKNPLTPDSLKSVTQVTYQVASMIVTDLDPKWFTQADKPVTLKDGKPANEITVAVDDTNKAEFSKILQANFPSIIEKIAASGIITTEQANQFKQLDLTTLQVAAPSSIKLEIDELGFIREQDIQINFSLHDASGAAVNHHLILQQNFDQINQNPKFTQAIPQKTKPLADVLKMLQPQK